MESLPQHREQAGESPRDLLRALVWSFALHALAFGMLFPEFDWTGRQVPPDRILQGQLRMPASPVTEAVAPVPASTPPSPRRQQAAPLLMSPVPVPTAAVPPEPTFQSSPQAAAESGGMIAPRESVAPATVAVATAPRESGPDAAGLRQYRLALAGEARRFKRYPEAARRAGMAGTAEIRVAVVHDQALAELSRSSGHTALDTAALDMLRQAAVRARLPESLRGQQFAVLLPVVFEVED